MKIQTSLSTIFVLLALVGCSSELRVHRLTNSSELENALEGPIYYLPTVSYDISITRRLEKCESNKAQDKGYLDFSITADITPIYEPDYSNPYRLDYNELNSDFKKTTLNLSLYENGTIKSINADIHDRSGIIIQNTAKGAVTFARIALGVPSVVPKEAGVPQLGTLCNEQTRKATEFYTQLKDEIRVLERDLPGIGPNDRPAKETELKQKKEELAKYASHISHTKTYRVTPSFDIDEVWHQELSTPASLFMRWFYYKMNKVQISYVEPMNALLEAIKKLEDEQSLLLKKAQETQDGADRTALQEQAKLIGNQIVAKYSEYSDVVGNEQLNARVRFIAKQLNAVVDTSRNGDLKDLAKKSKSTADETSNLVYRQPGEGIIHVCKFSSCEDYGNSLHRKTYVMPQAGIHTTLPLKNEAFDKNVLTASFGPAGNLQSFQYITEAQAEAMSAAFADIASAAGNIADSEKDSDVVELQRDLDILNLQNQILEATSLNESLTGE